MITHTNRNAFTRQAIGKPALEFFGAVDETVLPPAAQAPKQFLEILEGKLSHFEYLKSLATQPIRPAVVELIQHCATYRVASLIFFENQWYLRCIRGEASGYSAGNNVFLYYQPAAATVADWTKNSIADKEFRLWDRFFFCFARPRCFE